MQRSQKKLHPQYSFLPSNFADYTSNNSCRSTATHDEIREILRISQDPIESGPEEVLGSHTLFQSHLPETVPNLQAKHAVHSTWPFRPVNLRVIKTLVSV